MARTSEGFRQLPGLGWEFYTSHFVKNKCGKREKTTKEKGKKLNTKEESRCMKDQIFK